MKSRTSPRLLISGTINWDTLLFVEKLPLPGEEVKVIKSLCMPGGKGANTAVTAARILGRGKVALLAILGNDMIASDQVKELHSNGVLTSSILRYEVESGRAFVAVDKTGQDMILTAMASNELMTPDLLARREKVSKSIRGASIVVITDPPLKAATWIATQAKNGGALLILSPALLAAYGLTKLRHYLQLADYIILNEQEANAMLDAHRPRPMASLSSAISDLLGGTKVVVTLGARGCMLSYREKTVRIPAMDLSLFGLSVLNTAGAGDAFVGTFAAYKKKGYDDIGSLLRANIAAALKTTKIEMRGSPTLEEIEFYAAEKNMASLFKKVRFS
jgi:ribokinase